MEKLKEQQAKWDRNQKLNLSKRPLSERPTTLESGGVSSAFPDRSHRLVAYPYYTKYAIAGNSTFFRHININIPRSLG